MGVAHADRTGPHKHLKLYHRGTNELMDIVYQRDGKYIPGALAEINYFMRDRDTDEVGDMDVNLIDTLHLVQSRFGLGRPIIVLSAFRSQVTHEKIRKRHRSAAQKSLHLEGKAVDIRIGGVSTQRLADVARGISQGGIGTYIEKAFVHIDTGERRSW